MKSLLAKTINVVLHPVLLTIPAVYLIVYSGTGKENIALFWTAFSVLFTAIVSAFVLIGVKMKFFNDLDVSNRKQRIILYPFVIGTVLVFVGFTYFMKGPVNLILASLLFIVSLLILDCINLRIKASIHVAGVAAIATGFIFYFGMPAVLLYLLIPVIAWARIIEKRHTLREAIVGGFCGIGLSVLSILIVELIV